MQVWGRPGEQKTKLSTTHGMYEKVPFLGALKDNLKLQICGVTQFYFLKRLLMVVAQVSLAGIFKLVVFCFLPRTSKTLF